jgi:hypothetical protein
MLSFIFAEICNIFSELKNIGKITLYMYAVDGIKKLNREYGTDLDKVPVYKLKWYCIIISMLPDTDTDGLLVDLFIDAIKPFKEYAARKKLEEIYKK